MLEAAANACREPTDGDLTESCSLIFHGTKGLGEACDHSTCGRTPAGALLRCARKAPVSGGTNPTCEVVSARVADSGRRAIVGDVCRSTCTQTSDGESCETSSADGTIPDNAATCYTNDDLYCDGERCARRASAGTPCFSSTLCGAGLACSVPESCSTGTPGCGDPGTCVPIPAAGEPCLYGYECGDAAYCDDAKLCAPRKALGEACGDSPIQCQTGECEDGVCVDAADLTRAQSCTK